MRIYSSTVPAMELNGAILSGDTSITLNTSSLPTISSGSGNTMTLVIRPDTEFEEIVYVTQHNASSTSYTVQRGRELTTAINHPDKATVRHMVTAADLSEPHYHINASKYSENNNTLVHGLNASDGKVVGESSTNTLSNKTIKLSDNNDIQGLTVNNVSGIAGTYAPLNSPVLTGTPTAPTAGSGTNTTQIATTAFVTGAVSGKQDVDTDLTALANLSTTGLVVRTGAGTAATRSIAVSGTGISISNADGVLGNPTITFTGGGTSGVTSVTGTTNQITVSPTTGAAVVSLPSNLILPNGTTATTQTAGDNSTKVATTAYVKTAVDAVSGGTAAVYRYASLYNTATTISSAGVILYANENLDSDAFHGTTNTSRIIIPAGLGGKYRISAFVNATYTAANGLVSIYLRKNGTTKLNNTDASTYISSSGNTQGSVMVETIVSLAAADYVEVYLTPPTGAGCSISSIFNIQYVGA